MGFFATPARPMTLTLRVLAHLLSYPDAELRAHRDAMREKRRHLLGAGVGGHVNVLGIEAQQRVAHAPAHPPGDVALGAQALRHAARSANNGALFIPAQAGHRSL